MVRVAKAAEGQISNNKRKASQRDRIKDLGLARRLPAPLECSPFLVLSWTQRLAPVCLERNQRLEGHVSMVNGDRRSGHYLRAYLQCWSHGAVVLLQTAVVWR